jgi:hypothetical protein
MATDGPTEGKAPTAQYQAQKKDMSHLARPLEDGLRLARPLWEKPRLARPRGNRFDRTSRRDVGPLGSHGMPGHAGGSNLWHGAGKDVPRHGSWRGQAITASPDGPPHRRSSRKMHRGLTPLILSGRTSSTKHTGEPVPPALLRHTSHVAPGSGAGTTPSYSTGPVRTTRREGEKWVPVTFLSLAHVSDPCP